MNLKRVLSFGILWSFDRASAGKSNRSRSLFVLLLSFLSFLTPIEPRRDKHSVLMDINHIHLPEWLVNNWLFRKLFLLRKLFLSRVSFKHYGQMAEDICLQKFFPDLREGFFVDVGCFHPIKYNNTYFLYRKRAWRGINIDIDSIKIEGFNIVRPKDINICQAVSSSTGELTYWTNGFYTPTVTLEKDFAKERSGKKYQYISKTVKTEPLTHIIDRTKFKDRTIDLLSIDVEGHDVHVLAGLDFERYAPKIIAVETQLKDFQDIQQEATYKLLASKGYTLANWVGMTLIFKHATFS